MIVESFRRLADHLPQPLLLLTASGRVVAANREALRVLDAPLVGRDLAETVEEPERFRRFLALSAGSSGSLPGTLRLVGQNGEGIAPEMLPYVFDRFRQADGTVTRRHGGLGLGLAIVRHLVELHGGLVVAESAGEDQGATFTVSLPVPLFQPPKAIDPAEAGDATAARPGLLAGVHVLLVEVE